MMISSVVTVVLLSGLLTMIAMLVAGRWDAITSILADGATMPRDRDQLVLPLRSVA